MERIDYNEFISHVIKNCCISIINKVELDGGKNYFLT